MVYGSAEYRKERDRKVHNKVDTRIQIIDEIPDNYFKALCYFSLIESFAQEYAKYCKGTTKNFCDFVLAFDTKYSFLCEIDPVTLYYDFESLLQDKFDLSFLDHGVYYNPDHAIQHGKANEMIATLNLEKKDGRIAHHRYVNLLYSLRSKLSHELSSHNDMLLTNLHLLDKYPYYNRCFRSYISSDKSIEDSVWELVVPIGFIRELALECINNYLAYSLKNKNDPFENERMDRKSHITWCDD